MRSFLTKPTEQLNQPPGTPVHVGDACDEPVTIDVLDYSSTHYAEMEIQDAEECRPFKEKESVTWLNINGVHDVELIKQLGESFELHPLVLEDIANTGQRAKYEEYEDYLYLVVKMISDDPGNEGIHTEQVSLLLKKGLVISFQEEEGDVFDPVRERIRREKGRIRRMGADYLAYALLDSIVDGYFVTLEILGDREEELQEKVMDNPQQETLGEIHSLKRQLIAFRRAVWPLREAVGALQKKESALLGEDIQPYLRDLYDHTIQVIDTVEVFRELVASIVDMYMNSLSNRMNEVMKVLTVMASIFIPLTFLAGIYGMNFEYMPELQWRWGYPAIWAVMGTLVAVMVFYFRRKEWI
ncbi:MAG: magnesium/cobalt transporter CorA [Planctomycetota bacterium]